MCFRGHAGMQREAADLAGIALQRACVTGQCLQRDDLAASVATGGDAVGHRTHPQPIHAVVATRAVGQEHGFVFAFEPAAARQVPAHAMRDGVGELRQLRRGGGAAQARLAPRGLDVRVVHAVEPQHVEVNIQVQRAAEALDQGHRTALRAGVVDADLIGQPAGDHALHDAQHRANGFWLAGEQETQGVRKAQHPLPHRPRAEHLLHQMPRRLGHAPCAAARAQPALLAGIRHQPLGTTVLADHAQEAVLEHAAAQVGLELLAHILGQRAVFGLKTRDEVRVVRLH
ncbi:hypothetical protein PAERUG_P42_1_London_26_VIM_2_10_12_00013 [Pseudomonas aeruginosa]|nr:hypothetical protein PAERUG_E11_London_26_VIM_2_06_13_00239 [Pseudomonas aeruginosa]CRP27977.1 hypothetical protein PAERUG_P42_1_London_26_VIM_2_10_12_00013 [Pseudomonas aeruginosa]